jgi:hypothetical protein
MICHISLHFYLIRKVKLSISSLLFYDKVYIVSTNITYMVLQTVYLFDKKLNISVAFLSKGT